MIIRPIGLNQIPEIQELALRIWPRVFSSILTEEQIQYMLEMMYSKISLENQIGRLGHQFLIIEEIGKPQGYVSYETDYNGKPQTKIHKLYLDPEIRGKGLGKQVLQQIEVLAKNKGNDSLTLNVNRNNPAIEFYQKSGFELAFEEKIDIGNGFIMDDWVMVKSLLVGKTKE